MQAPKEKNLRLSRLLVITAVGAGVTLAGMRVFGMPGALAGLLFGWAAIYAAAEEPPEDGPPPPGGNWLKKDGPAWNGYRGQR